MYSRSKVQRASIQYLELRTITGALGYVSGCALEDWSLCLAGMTGLKVIRILEYAHPGYGNPISSDILNIVSTCNPCVEMVAQDVYHYHEDVWFTANRGTIAALDSNRM